MPSYVEDASLSVIHQVTDSLAEVNEIAWYRKLLKELLKSGSRKR